jgi:hypothetical protein
MKKTIIAGLILLSGISVWAATQYQTIGAVQMSSATASGGFALWNLPLAAINALTPTATGQMVFCTNCTAGGNTGGTVCISTAGFPTNTLVGQFILSTGTVCK